jgi:KUP system potassium uptake protein
MQIRASADSKAGSGHSSSPGLVLGCLGVVYGDIGTSPLYSFREAVRAAVTGAPDQGVVYGILSLIFWTLVVVVTLKYVLLMLRADNKGEGGILSLMALAQTAVGKKFGIVFVMGITGAALFYGDAAITPAISVLSAIEGLSLATPAFDKIVLPITLVILVGLFVMQKRGTHKVSGLFGPLMVLWFAMLAFSGLYRIALDPAVLMALNPWYALSFIASHMGVALPVLGAVFLAVTGAEALYADLGHFGKRPIRAAWLYMVFPCLVINYFGQGAFVLRNPNGLDNPFYLMLPDWALLPAVVMAAVATVIASQAVITGAYSLTQQAIQLGLLPRMEIRHTSAEQEGQIYMPKVNMLLLYMVLFLCCVFKSSSALAAAYGIAVTGTMIVTTVLAFIVARQVWHMSPLRAALLTGPFLIIEAVFLFANMQKVADGGYVPLGVGAIVMVMMMTWVRGTRHLYQQTHHSTVSLATLQDGLDRNPPTEIGGTAVFMTSDPLNAPIALMQNIRHNHVIHRHNIILTVVVTHAPRVADEQRLMVEHVSPRFTRVLMVFGYAETPDVPRAMMLGARQDNALAHLHDATYFLGRRSITTSGARALQDRLARQWQDCAAPERPSLARKIFLGWFQRTAAGLPSWQGHLYIMLAGAAATATDFYRIPRSQVVELGIQLSI